MTNAVIIAVLIIAVYLALKYVIGKLARHELSCGGSCNACPSASLCHLDSAAKDNAKIT